MKDAWPSDCPVRFPFKMQTGDGGWSGAVWPGAYRAFSTGTPLPPGHRAAFPGYPMVCSVRLAGTLASGFPVRVRALGCEHGLGTACSQIPSGLFLLSAPLAQAYCIRMLLRALSSVSASVTGTGG